MSKPSAEILDGLVRFTVRYAMANDSTAELELHASGFIVKVHGHWTDQALDQFRHFLRLRKLAPSDDELLAALRQAKEKYLDGPCRLSVCAAQPCGAKLGFDVSDAALQSASRQAKAGLEGLK